MAKRLFVQDAIRLRRSSTRITHDRIVSWLSSKTVLNYDLARERLEKCTGANFTLDQCTSDLDPKKQYDRINLSAIEAAYPTLARKNLRFFPQKSDLLKISADVALKLNGFGVLVDKQAQKLCLLSIQFRKGPPIDEFHAALHMTLAKQHYRKFFEFREASFALLDLAERAKGQGRGAVLHELDKMGEVSDENRTEFFKPVVEAVRMMRSEGSPQAAAFDASKMTQDPFI